MVGLDDVCLVASGCRNKWRLLEWAVAGDSLTGELSFRQSGAFRIGLDALD